jgi:thiosulfate dehydrogenase (quinone) large subunit
MKAEPIAIEQPRVTRLLFADTRFGWLWLPLRLYLGWVWLKAGWPKLFDSNWMGSGEALLNFWERALKTSPKPVIAFDWYRDFIQFLVNSEAHTWFSKLIIFGELAVGVALVLGAFTGVAGFFGALMNWNYIMAGSASTNGMLFAIAVWLVLAWRNAGWIGVDRWLLPTIVAPSKSTRPDQGKLQQELYGAPVFLGYAANAAKNTNDKPKPARRDLMDQERAEQGYEGSQAR